MDGLSRLILDLDPARTTWAGFADQARDPIEELATQMHRLRSEIAARRHSETPSPATQKLDAALEQAAITLAELGHALEDKVDAAQWRNFYARLGASYEEMRRLVDALPQPVPAGATPKISRMNFTRAGFHVGSGIFSALLYHYFLTRPQGIVVISVLVGSFLSMEVARRRWPKFNDFLMASPLIKSIARPHEYVRINSSTYFGIGLLLATITCPKVAVELGCVVLAIGDPVASTLGRRYGSFKLYRDKSWVGFIAFFVAGAAACFAYLALLHPDMANPARIGLVAAAAGAVAELLTTRLDDNLTIPLATALAASLLAV